MIQCKPILLNNLKFEVMVYNPAQQEELKSNSIELLKNLRTQLKNEQIQMVVRIEEINEKKRAYTSSEKFEFLKEINPLLSKLKEEFDLDIE
jgi:DNA polymerase-3 subunit gamma/tau